MKVDSGASQHSKRKRLIKLLQGSYQHKVRGGTTGGWFVILTKREWNQDCKGPLLYYMELGRHKKEQKYLYVAHKSVTDSNIE